MTPYDFGEQSLDIAAFRVGQAGKFEDAFALLRLNEGLFPGSSGMAVFQGNIYLMKGDTSSAATRSGRPSSGIPRTAKRRGGCRILG